MKLTFCGLLSIVFIVLKLTEVIAWSWLWVLAPLWAPIVIYVILQAVIFLLFFLTLFFKS